jgi:exosortase/archaeosortase family protein
LFAYYFPYRSGIALALINSYLSAYAHLAGAVVRLFDRSVHVTGTHIDGRMSLVFALNCDAMDVFILFGAAVVSFPVGWRSRAVGLCLGLGAVVLVNVLRLVSLYFIGVYLPARFDFCHLQLWPPVIVVLATGGFLCWARAAKKWTPMRASDARSKG